MIQRAAEDDSEAGGAAGGPAGDERVLCPVEVEVPVLTVVALQPRVRACGRQQAVDLPCCRVYVAVGDIAENRAQGRGEVPELCGLLLREWPA